MSVFEDGPRSTVIANLLVTLREASPNLELGEEIHEAVEVLVAVDGVTTDRFTRHADGTFTHQDLVAGTSTVA
jgi:hypothetical protein